MRKLLLLLVLVLGMGLSATAEPLYLSVVDIGLSGNRDGSVGNELLPSDIVAIDVYLAFNNASPGYPMYSGWSVDGLDIAMTATGPGSLDLDFAGVTAHPSGGEPRWLPGYGSYEVAGVVETPQKIAIDGVATYNGWNAYMDLVADDLMFLEGFLFHCDGPGAVEVALELDGPVVYPVPGYPGIGGVNIISPTSNWYMYPGSWGGSPIYPITDYLGSVVINQVPEPFTLGLLGLGGLALIRRRFF